MRRRMVPVLSALVVLVVAAVVALAVPALH